VCCVVHGACTWADFGLIFLQGLRGVEKTREIVSWQFIPNTYQQCHMQFDSTLKKFVCSHWRFSTFNPTNRVVRQTSTHACIHTSTHPHIHASTHPCIHTTPENVLCPHPSEAIKCPQQSQHSSKATEGRRTKTLGHCTAKHAQGARGKSVFFQRLSLYDGFSR
jgi:hypothetical protein